MAHRFNCVDEIKTDLATLHREFEAHLWRGVGERMVSPLCSESILGHILYECSLIFGFEQEKHTACEKENKAVACQTFGESRFGDYFSLRI